MSDPAFQRNGVFNFRGLPRGKSQIVIPMTSAKTPTEIRDKIYTYSIPDEDAVLAPNRQERNSSLHPKRPLDTLQLAHVCQQVRFEFFPLYYQPHVRVRGRDFARFTQDFVVHGDMKQSDSTVCVIPPMSRHHGVMDVLPFMRLLRDSILREDGFELY
jgi:hypothetical protein